MIDGQENPTTKEAEDSADSPVPPRAARRGRRRGGAFDRDLTQGSIVKNLLSLAGPAMAGNTIQLLGTTADTIWVGRLGAKQLAAIGVATTVFRLMSSARMGLTTGTRALVARYYGANDIAMANHVAFQALVLSLGFAGIIAIIGILFAEAMLLLMGLEPEVAAAGAGYVRIVFVGSVFLSVVMMVNGALQAAGDMVTPMWITTGYRLFQIVIDPLLIFGLLGLPRLELIGAALANVFSQALGCIIGLSVLFSGRSRLKLTLRNSRVDFDILWRIIKIGIPASISGTERSLTATLSMVIVATFGTYAVAARAVALRLENIVMMLGWGGLGIAAAAMVGQNLGADQPGRAERSAWTAIGLYLLVMAVIGAVYLLWPEAIICIFNPDPQLVDIGSTWLRISVAGFVFRTFYFILNQVLGAGAGDALSPMIVSLAGSWLVELPLSVLFPMITGLGVFGVTWAIVVGMAARAAAITGWFQTGRWKKKRV